MTRTAPVLADRKEIYVRIEALPWAAPCGRCKRPAVASCLPEYSHGRSGALWRPHGPSILALQN